MGDASRDTTLRVGCAQLAARDVAHSEEALADALDAVEAAARRGCDLVLLPECTYPAYFLAGELPADLRADEEVVDLFRQAARRHGVGVAVGLAQGLGQPGGGSNSAVLIDAGGEVLLRAQKRFLWDFDSRWFAPGTEGGTAALGSVPTGMFVCADGRMPEVPRGLAIDGARLLLDPTAWVSTGTTAEALTNPQPEFLMAVRALENGVWLAAANKVGVERGTVVYCGNSGIWAPDGTCVARAGSAGPELVVADVAAGDAPGPSVRRSPRRYAALCEAVTSPAVVDRLERPFVPRRASLRAGLMQSASVESAGPLADALAASAAAIEALQVRLVASVTREDVSSVRAELEASGASLPAAVVAGVADGDGAIRHCLVAAAGEVREVSADPEPGDVAWRDARMLDVEPFRVGVLIGDEGLVPEVSRVLTLGGAEAIVWLADAATPRATELARARALENRVYVGTVVPPGADPGAAFACDPDGRVVAAGLTGGDQLVTALLQLAIARFKEMAPGSDVLAARQPDSYGSLIAETV